ncbi:hypothetical protein FQA39_LY03047 [Lamprigera yunnana]|nr:hypothetical protein FQA39_LY03047 [Lamprigera yunnana]
MALVAYDDSSEEEVTDSDKNDNTYLDGKCTLTKLSKSEENGTTSGNLFATLPPPSAPEVPQKEVDDEFLHKKETPIEKPRKRIQLTIPALSDYSSDDDMPTKKKFKKSISGLFATLPPPKGATLTNTSFVPNVLQKRETKKPKIIPKQAKEPAQNVTKMSKSGNESDSCDEDIQVPDTFDDETWLKVCARKKKPLVTPKPVVVPEQESTSVVAAPTVCKPYDGLDNKAFKELVGSSKRIPTNIKLIDIHEDTIRPDKEVWLKSLTDPDFEAEPVIENPVDSTRKSRNHITALAQRALANDKELQKQWSENRYNRKQTQAKYGF